MKRSQMTFPKELAGIPLNPESRQGERYCAEFQAGTCQEKHPCRSGAHKCAALFRRGRTCHGNHAGSKCNQTKRHASSAKDYAREEPVQKATRRQNPSSHPGPSYTIIPEEPGYVTDDSIMMQMLPSLSEDKWNMQGNRRYPEPPRLVAKVCREEGMGELWLGPLPTAGRMPVITQTKHSIQIYCFKDHPESQEVQRGGEWGTVIPDSLIFKCEMSNSHARLKDMHELLPHTNY